MTKSSAKYIKENLPYYGKIDSSTKRGKDTLSKKAWVITSAYIRLRDFIKYGCCVSCKVRITDWREGDPAHYHSFAGNGALSGFHEMNIHLSCKYCNAWRGAAAGHEMATELKQRYGEDILNTLQQVKNKSVKADDFFYIGIIETMYAKLKALKQNHPNYTYPDYI